MVTGWRRFSFFWVLMANASGYISGQNSDSLMWTKSLDEVVVTAQFTPTETRETVNSVKVLGRKAIEQRAVVTLQELLQTEPNLRITQDPILGSEISINGLKGENLKILVDGVPIVGRLNGNIDAGQIPLSSIQKIEIIEGAQSLLYGSEASGGVINLITKKSQTKTYETEVNGQYETNGFRTLAARAGTGTRKFNMQISGNLIQFRPQPDSTGQRDQIWNPKDQKSARALVRYQPDDKTDIRLTANVMNESVTNLGELKRPVFKPYAFDDYFFTDRFDVSMGTDRWTKNGHLMQMTLGYNRFERLKNSYRHDFESAYDQLLENEQDTSSATGVLTRFTFAGDKKEKVWSYLLGAENYFETATGTRLNDTTSADPHKAHTNDLGIFGSLKARPTPSLSLQAGLRWTSNIRYGNALTPSTWASWKPSKKMSLKMSWAYGFRSPSVKELFFSFIDVNHYVIGRADLRPEKSVNLRGEANYSLIDRSDLEAGFTVTGFYNKVRDRIVLTALGPVHYEYQNIDTWETAGAGAALNLRAGDWLTYRSNVLATGFDNAEMELLNKKYLWSADWANELTIHFLEGDLSVNIWHKLTGKTPFFYNENGTTKQGITDTWNMLNTGLVYYAAGKKLRINLAVKNIFDIRQLQLNNSNGIHIEASNQQNLHWGRNYCVGITWTWQK